MSRLFYPKLAAQGIRKNRQIYLPYILTCICAVAMYYIICTLSKSEAAGQTVAIVLQLGTWVMGIFSVAFLFYTNSFLMKRRKKEFGLYNILGMEKKHIFKIVFFETLYTALIGISLGLAFGVLLYKLVHLILLRILQFDFRFGFEISAAAMGSSLALFGVIFGLLLLSSLWRIQIAAPIELLKGGETGEREPKAKWLIALFGAACLGAGYYISVTTEKPLMVIGLFFVAVILVIIGTYFLFTAGGVALLKLLRKNRDYYYKPNHFIAVSGMMYRMKQNAAGLATICILATMVLVMISSTAALYFGMEDSLLQRYPRDVIVTLASDDDAHVDATDEAVAAVLAARGLAPENLLGYRVLPLSGYREGDGFHLSDLYYSDRDMVDVLFVTAEGYESMSGERISLAPGEVFLCTTGDAYGAETVAFFGSTYRVAGERRGLGALSLSSAYNSEMVPIYYVVVEDLAALRRIQADYAADAEEGTRLLYYALGFDLAAEDDDIIDISHELASALPAEEGIRHNVEARAANREGFLVLYGGLFFLGLFLGVVFILATVLIIYYKQVSEGYDDQRRYAIMQNVGLSHREVRRAINSQVLTMFFLPLFAAFLHIAFAFPAITRLLAVLNLRNTPLFLLTTILSAALFTVFYVLVYNRTAAIYYRIVEA